MMPPDALTVELMTDGKTHPALIDFLFDRHKEAGLHPIVALVNFFGGDRKLRNCTDDCAERVHWFRLQQNLGRHQGQSKRNTL